MIVVWQAVLDRIDIDGGDSLLLTLLAELCPSYSEPLEKIMAAFRSKQNKLREVHIEKVRVTLAQQHAIQGTAVVPNPASDEIYDNQLKSIRDQTKLQLKALFEQVTDFF